MLRAEALRSKKEELATCLRSRKRKLHELYFATVHCTAVESKPSDAVEDQNEASFLDANDITKGLYFNEATLPPRPDIRIHLSHHRRPPQRTSAPPRTPEPNSTTITQDKEVPLSSDQSPPLHDALPRITDGDLERPPIPTQVKDTGASQKEENVKRSIVEGDKGPESTDIDQRNIPEILEQSRIETVVESPARSPGIDPASIKTPSLDVPEKALVPQKRDPLIQPAPSPGVSSTAVDTAQLDRQNGVPTPTALIPPATDLASSPASTNGLDSASTPRPPAGSPDTSPGDEVPPTSSQDTRLDAQKLPKDNDPAKKIPELTSSLEPSTATSNAGRDATPETLPSTSQGTAMSAGYASTNQLTPKPPPPKRPHMRIDTVSAGPSGFVESPAEMTGRMIATMTPRRPAPPSATVQSPPERMTTRVSSGAIRHKSVHEILGETPKPSSPQNDRGSSDSSRAGSANEPALAISGRDTPVSTSIQRQPDRREKEKERSRLSTVVFPKQQASTEQTDTIELLRKVTGEQSLTRHQRDYLYSLFVAKANSAPRAPSLAQLLSSANKTLSTTDYLVDQKEQKSVRTLKRIYQLQNANRWPLRQTERSPEPPRQTSQWDFVLDHARWLRTDFREERKWKAAAARGLAEWCAEFVVSDREKQKSLQVKLRPPRILKDHQPSGIKPSDSRDSASSPVQPTPDLVPSSEDDSVSEGFVEDPRHVLMNQTPAAIFALGPAEFNFCYGRTPAAEKLLEELPLYEPSKIEPDLSQSDLAERRDLKWKKDLVPISKFTTTKIHLIPSRPPQKRSRYDYEQDLNLHNDSEPLPPKQTDVALFMPENKHIRDRIHPGHSFRPPTEHPMPTQGFFESRFSSQWTAAEDDELRKIVRDYSYNWSLISSCLSQSSAYHAGADRRTPWECFERWIGLEGLPADMSKTPYFKAYHARIEAAGKTVAAQQQAAQQQVAGSQVSVKRRHTLPLRVERKRNSKHLALVDAFRKLAKKREVAAQKQQHAAGLAAMRKANEANQPKPPIQTPQQFSRLKHDREQKLAERQELYRQQMLAQQKAAAQQRSGQLGVQNGNSTAARNVNGMTGALPAAPPLANLPNGQFPIGPSSQSRAMQGVQGLPNSQQINTVMAANATNMKNLAQVPGQGNATGNRAQMGSPENMRMFMEATRLQQEQQRYVHQRQIAQQQSQQGQPVPQPSPKPPMAMMNGGSGNGSNMMAAMQANGNLSPAVNNASQPSNGTAGSSASPRLSAGQPLSSGVMPQISQIVARISQQQPDLSAEEVQRRATQQLARNSQRSMNQAALNAAAGAANAGHAASYAGYGMPNGMQSGMMTNEQVQRYNQLVKQQAAAHQRNVSNLSNGSPSMTMARPVSGHGMDSNQGASPQIQRAGSQGQISQVNGQGPQSKSPDTSQQQMAT